MKRLSDQVCVGGNHFITLFFAFEGGGKNKSLAICGDNTSSSEGTS